jgi:hypothetical protein
VRVSVVRVSVVRVSVVRVGMVRVGMVRVRAAARGRIPATAWGPRPVAPGRARAFGARDQRITLIFSMSPRNVVSAPSMRTR